MKKYSHKFIGAAFAFLFTLGSTPGFGQATPLQELSVQDRLQTINQLNAVPQRAANRAKPQPTKLDRIAEKLKVAEPVAHANLAIFLIEGENRLDTSKVLTLDEALKKKGTIVVNETGTVDELSVLNKDAEHTVFIMAGDIVKGGKQDRTLAYDLPLRKEAGTVPIASFCVEQGRWQARGSENVAAFSSSGNSVASKEQKIAVRKAKSQGEVWEKVAGDQAKISSNIGKSVNSAASPTSLQLSLEDKDLKKQVGAYLEVLKPIVSKNEKAVGFVIVINGHINSAEIFASHDLLNRSWPKLAESAAIEAVAELKAKPAEKAATAADAMDFLAKTEDAEATEENIQGSYWNVTAESPGVLLFQTVDKDKNGLWLRRSIIKK